MAGRLTSTSISRSPKKTVASTSGTKGQSDPLLRKKSPSSSSGTNYFLLFVMASFLIGIMSILLPFWMAIDCRAFPRLTEDQQPWPMVKLTKFKCGSQAFIEKAGTISNLSNKEKGQGTFSIRDTLSKSSSPSMPPKEEPSVNYGGKLKVAAAGYCIKKAESTSVSAICGEDAYTVNLSNRAPGDGRTFLAVADGVGGWSLSGGDSSKISNGILEQMKSIISNTESSLSEAESLAFAKMTQQSHKSGSTTVCASLLDHKTGRLQISNVGDSGAYVFRGDQILLKTESGQEAFNAPHQLGFDEVGNAYGSFNLMETKYNVTLKPGDIIVLATDGILDNLYDEELREMVVAMVGSAISSSSATGNNRRINPAAGTGVALQERVKSTATSLAWHAWARSQESHWLSPFAQAALVHGFPYYGGKQDDITIVVAVITT